MSPDQIFNFVLGAALIAAGSYLAIKPKRTASIIQHYYTSRAESETARGWLGKTVFLPGERTSLAIVAVIVVLAFGLGVSAIFSALR